MAIEVPNVKFTVSMTDEVNRTGSNVMTYSVPQIEDTSSPGSEIDDPTYVSLKVYKDGSYPTPTVTLTTEETWTDNSWTESTYYQLGFNDNVPSETLTDLLSFPYKPVYKPKSYAYINGAIELWQADQQDDTLSHSRLVRLKLRHELEIGRLGASPKLSSLKHTIAAPLAQDDLMKDNLPLVVIENQQSAIQHAINFSEDRFDHQFRLNVIDAKPNIYQALTEIEDIQTQVYAVLRGTLSTDRFNLACVGGTIQLRDIRINPPELMEMAEQHQQIYMVGEILLTAELLRDIPS